MLRSKELRVFCMNSKQTGLDLFSKSLLSCLGWSELATAKLLYCQLTGRVLSTTPQVYWVQYVILSCHTYSNCSCCFSNNGESLAYMSFKELQGWILRHELCKLNQEVLIRFVFLKSYGSSVFCGCGRGYLCSCNPVIDILSYHKYITAKIVLAK